MKSKSESRPKDVLSRRSLLGQAVGAAAVISALQSSGPANAQTPSVGDNRATCDAPTLRSGPGGPSPLRSRA